MRHSTRAVIATAFLALVARADAHAWADISFAGLDMSATGSGATFGATFFGQPIPGGTSYTQTFPYTITLHTDGDAAGRSWDDCVPMTAPVCGPAPTGTELVEFQFGFERTRESSPFTDYTFSGLPSTALLTDAGTVTWSGSFSITETVAPMGTYEDLDYLAVWAATWIDSADVASPAPEPGTGLLMLLGLGALGAGRRWPGRDGRAAAA